MMYYYLVDADAPHGQVFRTCVSWAPPMPTTKEGWLSLVDRALRKRSFGEFGLQNYYDMFSDRDEAEQVAVETLVDEIRLVTIEPA